MKWFQAIGGFWPTASFPKAASAIKYVGHVAFERSNRDLPASSNNIAEPTDGEINAYLDSLK